MGDGGRGIGLWQVASGEVASGLEERGQKRREEGKGFGLGRQIYFV